MGTTRRNEITRDDSLGILGVAALAGIAAMFAGCEPTGAAVPDAVLCFGAAAFITWVGAASPWWALLAAAGAASMAASFGSLPVLGLAWASMAAAIWIGANKANQPVLRAGIAAVTVQVAFRLELDRFFFFSGTVALAIIGLLVITGILRRPRFVRRRILFAGLGVSVLAVLAGVGMGVGGVAARTDASSGYQLLLDGLEDLDGGDTVGAAESLRSAAISLKAAHKNLDAVYTQPARLVPVIAQNRRAATDVIGRAAEAAEAAAATLDLVDLQQLTIINGRVDVDGLALLAVPLGELQATVTELADVLRDADSPWLVAPLHARLDRAQRRADQVSQQATALSAVAQQGPAMLGADRPRRYLLAFTNSAEARATAGLMGNWSELTISNGQLSITASGRTNDLENGISGPEPVNIDMPAEYFARYGKYGAGEPSTTVRRKFWGNATMTPDMPRVGSAFGQLYETATGRSVDGVIVLDPAGIAALLNVTGSVTVDALGITLSADNAEQFLLLDQYETAESEREDVLEFVTAAAVDAVLTSELPSPPDMIAALSQPALEGHISVWAAEPAEQSMLAIVGIEAALPVFDEERPETDGLAVVTNNANANKIDSFLQRTVSYSASYSPTNGFVQSTLEVTLTNNAPPSGLTDYVIGNKTGLPKGSNRTLLSVYSPLTLVSVTMDGSGIPTEGERELGWNVYTRSADIPPGGSVTFVFTFDGLVEAGPYALAYRPQGLPNPDELTIDIENSDGDNLVSFTGTVGRRTLFDADGMRAWR